MKKIGILGGIAWLSTVEYYAGICRLSQLYQAGVQGSSHEGGSTPEMCIESLDIKKAVAWLGVGTDEDSWYRFDEYHRSALQRLEAAGADFAVMASNTPHHRYAQIMRDVEIPVLNLFEIMAGECARMGAKRVLVLGTSLTMNSEILRAWFSKHGIEASGPPDRILQHQVLELITELQRGMQAGAASCIESIVEQVFAWQFTETPVVCLACTELPLAFPESGGLKIFESGGITYLNTTAAHIQAAFDYASRG